VNGRLSTSPLVVFFFLFGFFSNKNRSISLWLLPSYFDMPFTNVPPSLRGSWSPSFLVIPILHPFCHLPFPRCVRRHLYPVVDDSSTNPLLSSFVCHFPTFVPIFGCSYRLKTLQIAVYQLPINLPQIVRPSGPFFPLPFPSFTSP